MIAQIVKAGLSSEFFQDNGSYRKIEGQPRYEGGEKTESRCQKNNSEYIHQPGEEHDEQTLGIGHNCLLPGFIINGKKRDKCDHRHVGKECREQALRMTGEISDRAYDRPADYEVNDIL